MWWNIIQPIVIIFMVLTVEKYRNNKADIDKITEEMLKEKALNRAIERNKRANKENKGRRK